MKIKSLAIIGLAALSFTACTKCSKDAQELNEAKKLLEQIPEATKNIQDQANITQNLREERKKKGDTLALNYKDLMNFMPKEISGYKLETPQGESLNYGEISYSQTTYKFNSPNGNIEISLADYNTVAELFTTMTLWSAGISLENEQGFQKTFNTNIPNTFAFEQWDKPGKTANVMYGIAGRFFLSVKVENQTNTDLAKKVATMVNIAELAKK